jgi:hypothetical protein
MKGKRAFFSSWQLLFDMLLRAVAVMVACDLDVRPVSAEDLTPELVAKVKPESELGKPQPSVGTDTPPFRAYQTPSNVPQTKPNDRGDSILRAAATEYILSGGSPSLDREMTLYAKHVVDYYDEGAKSDDQIRADLSQFRRRWPSRRYEISRVVRTEYDPNTDVGSVVIEYSFEVSNGAKRKTGQVESFLVFASVSKQPRVILVNEHQVQPVDSAKIRSSPGS